MPIDPAPDNEVNQAEGNVATQEQEAPKTDVNAAPSPAKDSPTPEASVSPQAEPKKTEQAVPYGRFSEVSKQRDSYKTELQKAQELNQKYLEMLGQFSPKPSQPQTTLEQQEAAKQLAEILAGQPQFKALSEQLRELQSKNSDYVQSQREQGFDKEEQYLSKWSEDRGINLDELKPQLQEWLDNHPRFKNIELQPGDYTVAAQAIYADRYKEFAERAANLKLIKDQELKKKGNSETPGSTGAKGNAKPVKMEDYLVQRIEEAGGIGNS